MFHLLEGIRFGYLSLIISYWETFVKTVFEKKLTQGKLLAILCNGGDFVPERNGHLKELRLKCGYTQQQVADVLGVTKATISKYESGQRKLRSDHVEKLSILFNVEPVYILLGVTSAEWRREMDNVMQREEEEEREYWESVLLTKPILDMIPLLERLNDDGQQKAVERVEELTEIPRYRRPDTLPAPPEGTDTTPAEKPTEGPENGE